MSQVVYNPKCGLCRKPIPNVLHDVKIAGCPHCGSYGTMGEDGYLRHQATYHQITNEYQKPYYLGEHINYQGLKYTVYAICMYHVEYDEWDTEDKQWVKGTGYVTEWYAQKKDKSQLVVMCDVDDKFYVNITYRNRKSTDVPAKNDASEYGKYVLWGFIGTDDVPLETSGYYRVVNGYTHESKTEDFSDAKINSYWKHKITPTQVKRMVVIGDVSMGKANEEFENISFFRNVFMAAFLAIFVLFVINSTEDSDGQKSNRIDFSYFLPNDEIDTTKVKPQLAGSFQLEAKRNYKFTAKGYISNTNQDADCMVTIVRQADKTVVEEAIIDFYRESGSDDEGYWEENVLEDAFKFQSDEAGVYDVFVAPDYENLRKPPISALTVEIAPSSYNDFYLWVGGLLLLSILIFQWHRENVVAYANLSHGTYLHDFWEGVSSI
jgi:hypothetical protein